MDLRKARTRTLIQLGGLIEKTGLLGHLDLASGDDLQKDPNTYESVATLMGALAELSESLSANDAPQRLLWREKGKAILAQY